MADPCTRDFSVNLPLLMLCLPALAPAPCCSPAFDPARPALQVPELQPFDHEHGLWTRVLSRHVKGDRFDYQALSESRGELDLYLLALRGVAAEELAGWTREQRCAFWINAYNAYTVHLVLMGYPLKDIRDLGSSASPVWQKDFIPLRHLDGGTDGELISLERIEQRILRPGFEDARVHAALDRASRSSPPRRSEAFAAERLDAQLDDQARRWLADPARNRFRSAQRRLEVSAIFEWFESDFERDAGSVPAWIARYAPREESAWLADAEEIAIDHLPYSWELDDVERPKR